MERNENHLQVWSATDCEFLNSHELLLNRTKVVRGRNHGRIGCCSGGLAGPSERSRAHAALTMSLNVIWRVIEACGSVGSILAAIGRSARVVSSKVRSFVTVPETTSRAIYIQSDELSQRGAEHVFAISDEDVRVLSYLDILSNSTLKELLETEKQHVLSMQADDFC